MSERDTFLVFDVGGKPEPAGSKTAYPIYAKAKCSACGARKLQHISVVDANQKRIKPWKELVASAAQQAHKGPPLVDRPLGWKVIVWLARPKAHYLASGAVKPLTSGVPGPGEAPAYPHKRPDLSKFLRGVEDALTGVVWGDDAQVVTHDTHKRYGDLMGCTIWVWRMP